MAIWSCPLPQSNVDNGSPNYTVAAISDNYFQQQYSAKIEHKFSDRVSLTGFYLYNRTNEPCAAYFKGGSDGPNRAADPSAGLTERRPQILALNSSWVLGNRFNGQLFPERVLRVAEQRNEFGG